MPSLNEKIMVSKAGRAREGHLWREKIKCEKQLFYLWFYQDG